MASTTHCPVCGRALDSESGTFCTQCQSTQSPVQSSVLTSHQPPIQGYHSSVQGILPSDEGPPIHPPIASATPPPGSPWLDLFWAFLIWGLSGAFLVGLDVALRFGLWAAHKELPKLEITRGVAIFSLVLTLGMQLVGLAASWMFVTQLGKKSFWRTLGWRWHPQFKWVHAVALAILMYGLGLLLSKILPHRETELEKILKMGTLIRVMVAVLAVATAPLVEEIVYRGVVYSAIERVGGKAAGVALVTFIFALVHVPQYWGSVAVITAIVSLSLVLTMLRAWTGSLLPCVATHLVYNGVQAVLLLLAPDKALEPAPHQSAAAALAAASTALTAFWQWLGWN